MPQLVELLYIILQSVHLVHMRLLKVKLYIVPAGVWKIVKRKKNLIYIFHQHEKYVNSYIIQLLMISN
jgi:hypothetical protein